MEEYMAEAQQETIIAATQRISITQYTDGFHPARLSSRLSLVSLERCLLSWGNTPLRRRWTSWQNFKMMARTVIILSRKRLKNKMVAAQPMRP